MNLLAIFHQLIHLIIIVTITASAIAGDLVKVVRVIDGDTFVIETGERVRLIGIDTPETVHPSKPVEFYGKEASNFTKQLIEGKRLRLEYDQQRKDRYGRVLAYAFLDSTFINAKLIQEGYAHAYTRFPFKYSEEFREYEREAMRKGVGLWRAVNDENDVR